MSRWDLLTASAGSGMLVMTADAIHSYTYLPGQLWSVEPQETEERRWKCGDDDEDVHDRVNDENKKDMGATDDVGEKGV